jgi:hypothetical protein
MKKLIKGSKAAKDFMAKIRAKRKTKTAPKKAAPKKNLGANKYPKPKLFKPTKKQTEMAAKKPVYESLNLKTTKINDKLNFNEKVGLIYGYMQITQNKIINRQKLTPFEEKLFYYVSKYGTHNGSKQAVKDKLI